MFGRHTQAFSNVFVQTKDRVVAMCIVVSEAFESLVSRPSTNLLWRGREPSSYQIDEVFKCKVSRFENHVGRETRCTNSISFLFVGTCK